MSLFSNNLDLATSSIPYPVCNKLCSCGAWVMSCSGVTTFTVPRENGGREASRGSQTAWISKYLASSNIIDVRILMFGLVALSSY